MGKTGIPLDFIDFLDLDLDLDPDPDPDFDSDNDWDWSANIGWKRRLKELGFSDTTA
ncbi:MAG: hypothetical protein QM518_15880 [Verrucomicrobiota bacterium]|mgnify:CR=1 FL=1|jgi:hypothetical protein|nr:hypothetical protein [Verrucomicrobiota bacterium]MDI9385773.1 hypothetical protein [Verrucomicrobiota bacterium]